MDQFTSAPEQNDTYYRKPAKPIEHPGSRFAKAASILGIASIVTAVMGTVFFPFVLSGLALILVTLSRGADRKFLPAAKRAIYTAGIGLSLNISIIFSAVYMFYHNADFKEAFHSTLNNRYESIYGGSFDEDWTAFLSQYGIKDPLGFVEGGVEE